MKKVLTFVTGLILLIGVAAFAQSSTGSSTKPPREHKARGAMTHQATGTISSVDANSLVLTHKVKGKEEQTTYTLNDQTRKVGELKAGEKATVHYKVESGQNVATMVKASGKVAKHAAADSSNTGTTSTASSARTHKR